MALNNQASAHTAGKENNWGARDRACGRGRGSWSASRSTHPGKGHSEVALPGDSPQPLRFQWNLNPVGNLSHFLLLPPQKRRGTAGHLSFPNKSHPTSLPGMGRPVAEARPPPRPQPEEGKGRGLWRPEGRPRGARTPGRPRSPAASSVGGRAEQPGGGAWPCPPGLLCAAKF